jgi:hypothetical protein
LSAATGGSRLFVYWRILPGRLAEARAAMSAWHLEVASRWPGSRMTLWVREEPTRTTLMEIHEHADGLNASLEQALRHAGDAVTLPFRDGARHVEVFSPLA